MSEVARALSARSRLAGDPVGLARDSGVFELRRSKKNLEDALVASEALIADAFKNILAEYERRLQLEYSSLQDSLKGVRARLEAEARAAIAEKEREFIEKVLAALRARIARSKSEEWYKEFMSRVLAKLAEEARAVGKLTVWVSRDDQSLARELVEKMRYDLIEIAPEPAEIIGGAVARDESGAVSIDYSVDTIIKSATLKLQALILKSLRES
ncbi:MAG: hypothetical protein QXS85_04950 [Acidilobaceae archaeon]